MNDCPVVLCWRLAANQTVIHWARDGGICHEGLDGRQWVKIWSTDGRVGLSAPLLNFGRLV